MARHDSSMATDVPHDQDETGEHLSRFGAQWRNDELVLALLHAVQMDNNPIFQLSSWHTPVFAALTIGAWRDRRRSTIHIYQCENASNIVAFLDIMHGGGRWSEYNSREAALARAGSR